MCEISLIQSSPLQGVRVDESICECVHAVLQGSSVCQSRTASCVDVCVHAVMLNRACSLCDVCGGGQTTSL